MGGSCFEQLGETPSVVDRELPELDNFYPTQVTASTKALFVLDDRGWPTAEHYFQAMKFPHNEQLQERIRATPLCTGEYGCYAMGHSEPPRSDWEAVKVDIMYAANLAKFEQNAALRQSLVATRGRIRARGDIHWATWNEVLLERIREELREEPERDSTVLDRRAAIMESYKATAQQMHRQQSGSAYAARTMASIVRHAARRELVGEGASGGTSRSITIARFKGFDVADQRQSGRQEQNADLCHETFEGEYRLDPLQPLVNGQPHFVASDSTESDGTDDCKHLYLGSKGDRRTWVLDTCLDVDEVGGALTLPVEETNAQGEPIFPSGTHSWRIYSGVSVDIVITADAVTQ